MPKAQAENFTVASLLLTRAQRRALLGIYGFARLVDDAGDEASGDREAMLEWIEDDVGRMLSGEPIHPLLRRLAPAARELGFPRRAFLRLIAANRQDQEVSRYTTYEELAAYCDLSANPVGELVLYVFHAATPERIRLSDAVCTGLQLAEHWQDVGEDYGRGRIYIPAEDLERFGVDEADLAAATPSQLLKELLAFEVERGRRLLDAGVELVRSLSGRAKLAVAGYVGGGRAAFDAIEASGYDVLVRAPKATGAARAAATARVLIEAR
ncbi:MAG: squalene synthase HpnC [Actinobacteria bacterium]|nr:squalene synthase HpnC [Actinomycetota bacterium]